MDKYYAIAIHKEEIINESKYVSVTWYVSIAALLTNIAALRRIAFVRLAGALVFDTCIAARPVRDVSTTALLAYITVLRRVTFVRCTTNTNKQAEKVEGKQEGHLSSPV
jgi:hypothetical protein